MRYVFFLASLSLALSVDAQNFRINTPLLRGSPSSVLDPIVHPGTSQVAFKSGGAAYVVPLDGSRPASFVTDEVSGSIFEFAGQGTYLIHHRPIHLGHTTIKALWSTRFDGGDAHPLTGLAQSAGSAVVTPDGGRVVFTSNQGLLSVRPQENADQAVTLHSGSLIEYRLVPDGSRVVWLMYQSGAYSFFSVPVDGSAAPTTLALDAVEFSSGESPDYAFELTSDSANLVYSVNDGDSTQKGVFIVPVDGSNAPTKLFGVPFNRSVRLVGIDPGDAYAVFRAARDQIRRNELFFVPLDGSQPEKKLNGPLAQNGDVIDAWISADSTYVVFAADVERNDQFGAYSVKMSGGYPVTTLGSGSDYDVLDVRLVGPDAVCLVRNGRVDRDDLYVVPIDGSALPRKLTDAHEPGARVQSWSDEPVGDSIAYLANMAPGRPVRAFHLDVSARETWIVNRPHPTRGTANEIELLPVNRALYVADDTIRGVRELVVADLGSGQRVRLSQDPMDDTVESGRVFSFEPGPNNRVAYDSGLLLHVVPAAPGNETAYPIFPFGPEQSGAVYDYEFSRDGKYLLMRAAPLQFGAVAKLFTYELETHEIRQLSAGIGGDVGHFELDPSSEFAVFHLGFHIYAAALDGSWRHVLHHPSLRFYSFELTPDGQHVVLGALDEVYGAAPLIGSSAQLLSGAHDPRIYELTADGRAVLFTEWGPTTGELFQSPLGGSSPPMSLGPVDRWLRARSLWSTPDGAFALTHEIRAPGTTLHLHRISLDGTAAHLQLTGGLGEEHIRIPVLIDGTRFVYTAQAAGGAGLQLFSVSLQGVVVALSGLPVRSFTTSPEGMVVFTTTTGLHSVPADGSRPPTALQLPPGSAVPNELRIGPKNRRVFSLHEVNGQSVVSSTPLDGSSPGRVHTHRGVDSFEVLPDGNRILYLSNVTGTYNDQLYLGYVTPPVGSASASASTSGSREQGVR